ncbi:hypothetical protein Ndes2526B_g03893 [Nannochloris sp. 'desiccata']|nr:hypothetical protein KSW81_005243 [Chlorella desiccata (nom. nud.)]KAH7621559.1 hypothetical protein NADE_006820 [Chlorella desiccata (nom. nud.)]
MNATKSFPGPRASRQEPCFARPSYNFQILPRSLSINNINHKHGRQKLCAASSSSFNDDSNDGYVHPRDREFQELRNAEDHPSYRREDMSESHSREARKAFLDAISQGEGAMNLAEAALQIAAEDDALVSHSSVKLPVAAFCRRLQRLADELIRVILPPLTERKASNKDILDAILDFLYTQQKFTLPNTGRSALLGAPIVVDAPGIWENPRLALLTEVLITKKGIPAALAIVVSDVLRRLLIAGAIDFVARVECSNMSSRPTVTLIDGITREMALGGSLGSSRSRTSTGTGDNTSSTIATTSNTNNNNNSDGLVLNMCTTDVLAECLSYLKRAYWPFPWDGLSGGFRGAASAFLDGAESAEAEAIARTARHRLERGIWTSPGAGDLRRALAAAERLVILRGDDAPEERRDLAVLYCHAGMFREAKVELRAYAAAQVNWAVSSQQKSQNKKPPPSLQSSASNNQVALPMKLSISSIGVSIASSLEDLPDAVLADRMLTLLGQIPMEKVERSSGKLKLQPLNFEEAERRCKEIGPAKILPLTW